MTPTSEEMIKSYAEERRAGGDLLGWTIDVDHQQATFVIPLDVDPGSYPTQISGVRIVLRRMPRPLSL
jgi:hypothetical protein